MAVTIYAGGALSRARFVGRAFEDVVAGGWGPRNMPAHCLERVFYVQCKWSCVLCSCT